MIQYKWKVKQGPHLKKGPWKKLDDRWKVNFNCKKYINYSINFFFFCTATPEMIEARQRANAVMNDMSLSMRQAREQAREINQSVRQRS